MPYANKPQSWDILFITNLTVVIYHDIYIYIYMYPLITASACPVIQFFPLAQNVTYCKYFNPWDWEHRHHKYHEEQGIAIPVICLKPRTRFGFEQTDARQMNYGEKNITI